VGGWWALSQNFTGGCFRAGRIKNPLGRLYFSNRARLVWNGICGDSFSPVGKSLGPLGNPIVVPTFPTMPLSILPKKSCFVPFALCAFRSPCFLHSFLRLIRWMVTFFFLSFQYHSRRQPDLAEDVPPDLVEEGMIHGLPGGPALVAVVHQQLVEEVHSLGFKERRWCLLMLLLRLRLR
jgi:hypothetical protein